MDRNLPGKTPSLVRRENIKLYDSPKSESKTTEALDFINSPSSQFKPIEPTEVHDAINPLPSESKPAEVHDAINPLPSESKPDEVHDAINPLPSESKPTEVHDPINPLPSESKPTEVHDATHLAPKPTKVEDKPPIHNETDIHKEQQKEIEINKGEETEKNDTETETNEGQETETKMETPIVKENETEIKMETEIRGHDAEINKEADTQEGQETEINKESEKEINEEHEETEKTDEAPLEEAEERSVAQIMEDIDQFLLMLSSQNDESTALEIPVFVEQFIDLLDAEVANYETGEGQAKFRHIGEEETSFLESVDLLSKMITTFGSIKSAMNYPFLLNRIGFVQQRAMSFLEDEFRTLLEDPRSPDQDTGESSKTKQETDATPLPNSESTDGDPVDFPGYSNDVVSVLNRIAKTLISGGYETECRETYIIARKHGLEESFNKSGFERVSIDDMQKMNWETLEREIITWLSTFKQCTTVYFSGDKKLAESVFSDHLPIAESLFGDLAKGVLIQLLNFAEGVAMTKRSAEKLFKILDIYECLRDMAGVIDGGLFPDECTGDVKGEMSSAKCRIGEAAISVFCELENSIKLDTAKNAVPGGAVHPLTRYVMNYLKYVCEYTETLEQVFKEHHKIERADSTSGPDYELPSQATTEMASESPVTVQLMRIMDLLDTNLEGKAKLYKEPALSNIFLMNNGRYILQKIKGSTEIYDLLGGSWSRKRSSDLRQYHKNYQRETWGKVLNCLKDEGLTVNGKVLKPVLKERFKGFNAMFDEIHRTQSSWVVSDEQLQSELRVSISSLVIPAYRSFMGRFSQILDPGRQYEKYIKFQPEDIETYIEELFDGNPMSSMLKRKT